MGVVTNITLSDVYTTIVVDENLMRTCIDLLRLFFKQTDQMHKGLLIDLCTNKGFDFLLLEDSQLNAVVDSSNIKEKKTVKLPPAPGLKETQYLILVDNPSKIPEMRCKVLKKLQQYYVPDELTISDDSSIIRFPNKNIVIYIKLANLDLVWDLHPKYFYTESCEGGAERFSLYFINRQEELDSITGLVNRLLSDLNVQFADRV